MEQYGGTGRRLERRERRQRFAEPGFAGRERRAARGVRPLEPAFLEPLLRGRFGRPYFYLARCETTQRLLDAAHPEGAVALCEEQTAGRGRLGRRWEAPAASSILMSVALRPPAGRRAAELTLVAAVATAVVLERATGIAAQVKWPNDVMLDRRKVAGGLAELRDATVVLGIGINVNQRLEELPTETKAPAASLRTVMGRTYDRAPILVDLLLELELRYDAWRDSGLAGVYDDLGARDFLRGRRVTVDGVPGLAHMITRDGRLEVETGSELLLVESGEVLFER